MRSVVVLMFLFVVSACAFDPMDRPTLSSFEAQSADSFVMSAYGRAKQDAWAGSNMKAHQRWIRQYLTKRNMCPQGFRIVDMKKTPTGRNRSHFLYHGVCNKGYSAPSRAYPSQQSTGQPYVTQPTPGQKPGRYAPPPGYGAPPMP